MNANWHVCSLVVQAHPRDMSIISNAINALEGGEVAASDAETGKMIAVLEADNSNTLLDNIESVRQFAGVLAVSLVYHQQDEQGEETP
ncbi:chaperone NapD [Entomohabitans teleogrylli]|uniref:chaperone NapD n=1 Tax=Entomohabitans teleogrylli TaxID=1384589 RepID=UPI00073D2B81|nr:chaperone NapD [Entomohabitans teleogrylli]